MGGCKSDFTRHIQVRMETGEFRTIPDSYAEKLIRHGLAIMPDDFEKLKREGGTMKVKLLRNGKVCDMPEQNAQAYIESGQAVAVEEPKAFVAPVKDKMVRKAPKTKDAEETVFVCPKCDKVYKTERGLKNHKCK